MGHLTSSIRHRGRFILCPSYISSCVRSPINYTRVHRENLQPASAVQALQIHLTTNSIRSCMSTAKPSALSINTQSTNQPPQISRTNYSYEGWQPYHHHHHLISTSPTFSRSYYKTQHEFGNRVSTPIRRILSYSEKYSSKKNIEKQQCKKCSINIVSASRLILSSQPSTITFKT